MRRTIRFLLPALWIGLSVLAQPMTPTAAQDDTAACQAVYDAAVQEMLESCFVMAAGEACAAAGTTTIDTTAGRTVGVPGGTVSLAEAAAVHTPTGETSTWSLARLHLTDTLDTSEYATLIVMGPAELVFDPEADDLPPGAAFSLSTDPAALPCDGLPQPGVLIQAPEKSLTLLRVNGVDLAVNGSAVIQPNGGGITVSSLTRETILAQTATVVFAGYGTNANGTDSPEITPYAPEAVAYLPTDTLPRMEVVAVPGSVSVIEETVLHLRPDASAYTGTKVKAGLPASVLGESSDGGWLHIRTYDGLIGWVPRSVLRVDVLGPIPVYDSAPAPPLRPFGPVQARGVTTAESNNLRNGPGQVYEIVTTVPYNTELAVYARDTTTEWLLVETPDGVRAWISLSIFNPTTPFALAEMPYAPE